MLSLSYSYSFKSYGLDLKLQPVQELRLLDPAWSLCYGLDLKLRLALGLRSDPESFRLSAKGLPRRNRRRLSLRATARLRATALPGELPVVSQRAAETKP